jgi:hypothetical protein
LTSDSSICQFSQFGGLPAGGAAGGPAAGLALEAVGIDDAVTLTRVSSTNAPTPPAAGSIMYMMDTSTVLPA